MALFVIMGVSGSGKSTVGTLLANRLGVAFADADDFHSPANVAKMAAGHPLTDEDRAPWLDAIGVWLDAHRDSGGIVTCSALRRSYRDRLRAGRAIRFVYLHGTHALLGQRLQERRGHFFQPHMLTSQLATLEEPDADENVVTISIDAAPAVIVDAIVDVIAGGIS